MHSEAGDDRVQPSRMTNRARRGGPPWTVKVVVALLTNHPGPKGIACHIA